MRLPVLAAVMLLASCAPPPAAGPSAAPQASAPPATAAAAQPAAAKPIPPGSTILSCTPIEDRQPPAGQVSVAQPFELLLGPDDKPIEFLNNTLPARIPFLVNKIEPAGGPPGLRVGALIHYAAKDNTHEMYSALAIMKDGTYQLGVMLKTPTQSTNGLVKAGHGTCVGKPA